MFKKLGPYLIEDLIGRGGMGAVYSAVHEESQERCAVKALAPNFSHDHQFRSRFQVEIETLKALRHPNIVRLIGYGEQDGQLFYAMELVDGRNLSEIAQSGRKFHWREVTSIAIQVCAALRHAHDHGAIHRDLKPANLIMTSEEVVKLTDFGIAKLFGASNMTSTGGVIGTADFMSPEQAEGKPVTPKTDLYSLGCVMYALLARRPPFGGKTVAEVLHSLKYDLPHPIRRVAPSTPEELEAIIHQLLEKDPDKRIANAMLLSRRLQAMEHGLQRGDEPDAVDDDDDSQRPNHTAATAVYQGDSLPTHVDGQPLPDSSFEMFEETVVNSSKRAAEGNNAEPTSTPTHFTVVDSPEARRSPAGAGDNESLSGDWRNWSTALMAAGLLAIVAAVWYASLPASGDALYKQIMVVAAVKPAKELSDVEGQMEQFVARFPNDPRRDEVLGYLNDHKSHRLWRRLERRARTSGGVDYLEEVQRAYVHAFRDKQKDKQLSRRKFENLLDQYGQRELSEEQEECVEAAKHLTSRLTESL